MTYLMVALGGALGSVLRFWLNGLISERVPTFPLGTLVINVTGSLVIGFIATFTGPEGRVLVHSNTRTFLMIGICGGYTTFSSFSLQTLNLAREGQWFAAGAYIVLSVVLCLLGVWLGHLGAQWLNR